MRLTLRDCFDMILQIARSVVMLPTISEENRRFEEELYAELDEAAARVLGALLDGLSGGLA
jgi:hypothetical protein